MKNAGLSPGRGIQDSPFLNMRFLLSNVKNKTYLPIEIEQKFHICIS